MSDARDSLTWCHLAKIQCREQQPEHDNNVSRRSRPRVWAQDGGASKSRPGFRIWRSPYPVKCSVSVNWARV
jgi:hypothetical protein